MLSKRFLYDLYFNLVSCVRCSKKTDKQLRQYFLYIPPRYKIREILIKNQKQKSREIFRDIH